MTWFATSGLYLIPLAALLFLANRPAALIIGLAVVAGQITTRLNVPQVYLLLAYTLLAVVATFYFDRYSGFVLAAVGLAIGAHVLGYVDHRPKVIAGEALLVVGMLFCGFIGPSGGIFEGRKSVDTYRHGADSGAVARGSEAASASVEQNLP